MSETAKTFMHFYKLMFCTSFWQLVGENIGNVHLDSKFTVHLSEYHAYFKFTLCLLVASADTFVNSLDPDQVRINIVSDLDPNCLTL